MMTKQYILIICLIFSWSITAQVGIGTTNVDASAMLQMESTSKGFLIPKLTQAQRDAIVAPAKSLIIYQIDLITGFYFYDGTSWQQLEKVGWGLNGNSGTNTAVNSFGTLDANDLVFSTNNTEAMRINTSGNLGLGTTAPTSKLHIEASFTASTIFTDGFEDNTLTPFTTSGNQNWLLQTGSVNSGTYAAQSGPIVHDQTTSLFLAVTIPAEGADLTFAMRTSSEACCDTLDLYINGAIVSEVGGDNAWQNYAYNLPAGSYNIEWRFTKDFSVDGGMDTVFVDDVLITEKLTPALIVQDGSEAIGKVMVSDANGVATWESPGVASSADADWEFNSGSLNSDPLYHKGTVMIGQTTTTPYNLQVYNGATTGSDAGFGSVEYLLDGTLETRVSDIFTGISDGTQNVGSLTQRWRAIYSVNGTINTSDIRTKEQIEPLTYGLKEVLQLEPVSFKWKEERIHDFIVPNNQKELKLGLIAQEVQKVLPEVVKDFQWKRYEENPDELVKFDAGRLGMSYSELIPVVVKAVQEQEVILQDLEATNKLLKAKIRALKAAKK